MPAIEWNDAYSVGDEEMDRQHRRLFAAINDLYDSMAVAMPDRERSLNCFKFLTEYTLTHFADEERLMRSMGFPGLQAHVDEHKKLVSRLEELAGRMAKAQPDNFLDDDMVIFLVGDWLLQHVVELDQKYAKALRAVP